MDLSLHENWNNAIAAYKRADYGTAQREFKSCRPSAKILFNIGMVYMAQLDFLNAIYKFEEALVLDDMLAIIYFQRGVCYFMTGDYQLALQDWEKTEELFRSNDFIDYNPLHMGFSLYRSELYINYAVTYYYLGDKANSQKYIDLAKKEKKLRDNLGDWVNKMNGQEDLYPITLDDQTLFAPPAVKFPGQQQNPQQPASQPQAITSPRVPVAKVTSAVPSSPTLSSSPPPAPPPAPAPAPSVSAKPKVSAAAPPPPPAKPGVAKTSAFAVKAPPVPNKPTTTGPLPTSVFATRKLDSPGESPVAPPKAAPPAKVTASASSPPPVPAAPSASGAKLSFKILASFGERKKKIVRETFSGFDELRNEVISSFDLSPQQSTLHVEHFDDDFNEWIELDRKTDLSSLPLMLKLRVVERN